MGFFYVYILFSHKDGCLYIGYTTDLKSRLIEHQTGRTRSTKNRRPLQLIHYESFANRKDAQSREKFLKSGFGRSQLKRALQNKLKELGYKYI